MGRGHESQNLDGETYDKTINRAAPVTHVKWLGNKHCNKYGSSPWKNPAICFGCGCGKGCSSRAMVGVESRWSEIKGKVLTPDWSGVAQSTCGPWRKTFEVRVCVRCRLLLHSLPFIAWSVPLSLPDKTACKQMQNSGLHDAQVGSYPINPVGTNSPLQSRTDHRVGHKGVGTGRN